MQVVYFMWYVCEVVKERDGQKNTCEWRLEADRRVNWIVGKMQIPYCLFELGGGVLIYWGCLFFGLTPGNFNSFTDWMIVLCLNLLWVDVMNWCADTIHKKQKAPRFLVLGLSEFLLFKDLHFPWLCAPFLFTFIDVCFVNVLFCERCSPARMLMFVMGPLMTACLSLSF